MKFNENKIRVEEKARLSLLKHRGDMSKVVEETGLDYKYIQRKYAKMRAEMKKNPSVYLANSLLQNILSGHEQRLLHYKAMLDNLDNADFVLVSSCCKAPIRRHRVRRENHMFCTFCNTRTSSTRLNMTELRKDVLESLRGEDEALIKFAESLGIVAKAIEEPTGGTFNQTNILVTNSKHKNVNKSMAEIMENMEPMERAKLRKGLEKTIVGSIVEGEIVG